MPHVCPVMSHVNAGLIFSNELATGEDGVSTGSIVGAVQCARDKAAVMQGLLQQCRDKDPAGSTPAGLVYIGDSVSDLKALLMVRTFNVCALVRF